MPSSAWNRRMEFPDTGGSSRPSETGPVARPPWDDSRGWSGLRPARHTALLQKGTNVAGPPVHAAVLGSWTGPFFQEIPLHLELAGLLVQASHQSVVVLLLLALGGSGAVGEDGGHAIGQSTLPSWNLAGANLEPGGRAASVCSPVFAFRATLGLKAGLCFLRSLGISCSFLTAAATLSLGAGPHLATCPVFRLFREFGEGS